MCVCVCVCVCGCLVLYMYSYKLVRLTWIVFVMGGNEPDMQDTAGETGTSS